MIDEIKAAWKLMPHRVYCVFIVVSFLKIACIMVLVTYRHQGKPEGMMWAVWIIIIHGMIWYGFIEKAKGH